MKRPSATHRTESRRDPSSNTTASGFDHTVRLCKRNAGALGRAVCAGFLLVLSQAPILAADITVVNSGDSGAGTLRQAILDVPVAGTIDFSPSLAGQTITVASELVLDKDLTIDAGTLVGGVTLSGGNSQRVLRVNASQNAILRSLTVSGGSGNVGTDNGFGGGLYNVGTTLVEKCTFNGSTAALYGGAIHNALGATLTVNSCTFAGNTAGLYGAAISNSSLLTVNGSTFNGNHADFEGGGIYSDFASTLTINNSTFTANSAAFFGGAIFNGSPRMIVNSSTLVANTAVRIGGGIYNDFFGTPSSKVNNCIVAQNNSPEGADIFGPRDDYFNFIGGDPKLSPLGSYGGPTQTMPPLPDSPVLDAAGVTTLSTDQRGQPRILVGGLDIGAFEVPFSDYNPSGVTIYTRVQELDQSGVFEISTDPDFLPAVTTFAGTGTAGFSTGPRLTAKLGYPSGVNRDSFGNLFFVDTGNHRIRMIGADGQVVTIAGTGEYGLANGSGSTAEFAFPAALAVGPDDNVYVADTYNHRICKLARPAVPGGSWAVTNLAGTGTSGFLDGAGSVARFNFPYGLALDADSNIYVADSGNNRIRKVTPTGLVSTYAGTGTAGAANHATATLATFHSPQSVTILGGNLFVADTFNDRIRKIVIATNAGDRTVTTFAGSSTGFSDGLGTAAQFDTPSGLANDGAGTLYVADEQNHKIRQITATGEVSTVAGTGVAGLLNGKSNIARFNAPTGVAAGLDGNLIVADAENHVLRRIAVKPLSIPSALVAGSGNADGVQVKSVLDVEALGLDPGVTYYFRWKSSTSGNTQLLGQSFYLYDFPVVITEAATNVSPGSAQLNGNVDPKNGRTVVTFEFSTDPGLLEPFEVSTRAGSGVAGFADAMGPAAQFSSPSGVVSNAAGDVFVADTQNHRIRKVTSAGLVSTFAGSGTAGFADGTGSAAQFERPAGLAVDASGNLYVADEANHRIRRITPAGEVTTFAGSGIAGFVEGDAAAARFLYPAGVAVDSDGNVYVADSGNHRIRMISAGNGFVTTLTGTGVAGSADGDYASAQFSSPRALVAGVGGSLVVADTGNHRIRMIEAGNVTTLAGSGVQGFADGPGASAEFDTPGSLTRDADGVVYVADAGNHRIRRIATDGQVSTLAGSGIPGQVDSPVLGLYPATACQLNQPAGITIDAQGRLFVTQEGLLRQIARAASLPSVTVTPDAEGTGPRHLFAAVDRPLLYGSTYYFRVRGTSYRDSITGSILSFVTPQAMQSVFNGSSTSAPQIEDQQSAAVEFGDTPTGQPVPRAITILNPGTWPLTVGSVSLPAGFQLSGSFGTIAPGSSTTANILLTASVAGDFGGDVVITSDAPEQSVFTFPITGKVIDPPGLLTLDSTNIESGSATFNASVDPKDSSTTVWFEWSQDPAFDGVSVSTLAGSTSGFQDGAAAAAKFNQPSGLVVDSSGNTYVADTQNHRIRIVAPDGSSSTFAGTGVAGYADGVGSAAQFNRPLGLAMNAGGVLFVTDSNNHRIRAISPAGVVSTYSGLGSVGFTDGIATAARFSSPAGLAIDNSGILYVADSGNHRIRKVALDGSVSTLAGTGTAGSANGTIAQAEFHAPLGITRDSSGYVYVTESTSHAIRRIAADGSTSIFAGSNNDSGFVDASGAAARFVNPVGLAVGVNGLLYVADMGNHRIRSINPAGLVKTIAGSGISGTLDGLGDVAQFFSPFSIATTADGGIIVGESGSSTLREVNPLQVLIQAAAGLTGTVPLSVSLPATGLPPTAPYYLRAIATNGGGTTVGNVIGMNVAIPAAGYDAWKTAKFGADAGNPLIAGPFATPAGDGVGNLLKYAFGLEPLVPAGDGMPIMEFAGGSLSIRYNQVIAATDITYTVEWSTDLIDWMSTGVTENEVNLDLTKREMLATVTAAPETAKFLRINVTQNP